MGENTPNKYTSEQKKWIIAQLVTHKNYREISEDFEVQFGKEIPKSTVAYYNPEISTGGKPAEHLVDLYWRLKEETREAVKRVDISDPVYRLRKLQNVIERHDNVRNKDYEGEDSRIIIRALKEARKEMEQFGFNETDEEGQKQVEAAQDPKALLKQFMDDDEEEDNGSESEETKRLESGASGESSEG